MRLENFKASQVHGYLNFDIPFNEDITFLIGINGTGKTTAVRTVHALLAPNLQMLGLTDFEIVSVTLEHEGMPVTITSEKTLQGLELSTSRTNERLSIGNFQLPPTEPSYKYTELALAYYRDQQTFHSEHEVLKLIRSLPTPMFLGLERRVQAERRLGSRRIPPRIRHNVFGSNLTESLDEASELAAVKFRTVQEQEDKLKDNLRNFLILRTFDFVNVFPFQLQAPFPSNAERAAVVEQRKRIREILISIGLAEDVIQADVDPFFNALDQLMGRLPIGRASDAETSLAKIDPAKVDWLLNKWQYDKVKNLMEMVDAYVASSKALYRPIDEYLAMVNMFFSEAEKRIIIDRFGMRVIIRDLEPRDPFSLSSGEQQLLVLLTHLAFNPAAQEANVLIIDEPEISLHVAWQEMFADALLRANNNIQFILATHSPSIILDREEKCIELMGH